MKECVPGLVDVVPDAFVVVMRLNRRPEPRCELFLARNEELQPIRALDDSHPVQLKTPLRVFINFVAEDEIKFRRRHLI
jgi:hypothetical protein